MSDEDSADEMEDDYKLLNGDVCNLFGLLHFLTICVFSIHQRQALCQILHAVADDSCLNQAAVMEYSPLLSYCLNVVYLQCYCRSWALLPLSLCWFVLISSFSHFSVCPLFFSSTLSKWKVLYQKLILSEPCAVLSHPTYESYRPINILP